LLGQLANPIEDLGNDFFLTWAWPRRVAVMHGYDFVDAHALGHPASIVVKGNAEVAENLELGLMPESLRIDEQAIHVEDGCSKVVETH
jgi:hypothetical protein